LLIRIERTIGIEFWCDAKVNTGARSATIATRVSDGVAAGCDSPSAFCAASLLSTFTPDACACCPILSGGPQEHYQPQRATSYVRPGDESDFAKSLMVSPSLVMRGRASMSGTATLSHSQHQPTLAPSK
jgi:hypothetical protein